MPICRKRCTLIIQKLIEFSILKRCYIIDTTLKANNAVYLENIRWIVLCKFAHQCLCILIGSGRNDFQRNSCLLFECWCNLICVDISSYSLVIKVINLILCPTLSE